MTWKKILIYSCWMLGFAVYLAFSFAVLETLQALNRTTMRYTLVTVVTSIALKALFGVLLGLEHFLHDIHRSGKWTLNSERLLLLALPFSLLAINVPYPRLLSAFPHMLSATPKLEAYAPIAAGYFLISSLSKENA